MAASTTTSGKQITLEERVIKLEKVVKDLIEWKKAGRKAKMQALMTKEINAYPTDVKELFGHNSTPCLPLVHNTKTKKKRRQEMGPGTVTKTLFATPRPTLSVTPRPTLSVTTPSSSPGLKLLRKTFDSSMKVKQLGPIANGLGITITKRDNRMIT